MAPHREHTDVYLEMKNLFSVELLKGAPGIEVYALCQAHSSMRGPGLPPWSFEQVWKDGFKMPENILPAGLACQFCTTAPLSAICVPCGCIGACRVCLVKEVQRPPTCPWCGTPVQKIMPYMHGGVLEAIQESTVSEPPSSATVQQLFPPEVAPASHHSDDSLESYHV